MAEQLEGPRPVLGAFSVAGFPDYRSGVGALVAYAESGAAVLEVGTPTVDPWLDGGAISAAHRCAIRAGHGVETTLATVRQVAVGTRNPIVVMCYWSSARTYGLQRLADALAEAGAAGCMVPDLPAEHVAAWRAVATRSGIDAPLLAGRQASAHQLAAVCRAATGFVYAPAMAAPTGYRGALDLKALTAFIKSIRRTTPAIPVVTGIGVSTPELASAIVRQVGVAGVMIGSPLVRALLSGRNGLRRATDLVEEFATVVTAPQGRRR